MTGPVEKLMNGWSAAWCMVVQGVRELFVCHWNITPELTEAAQREKVRGRAGERTTSWPWERRADGGRTRAGAMACERHVAVWGGPGWQVELTGVRRLVDLLDERVFELE